MVAPWPNLRGAIAIVAMLPILVAANGRSIWDRLDPVRRAQLLMALLALLLLGFLLVMLVLVGARYVRRLARARRTAGVVADAWYQRPQPSQGDSPGEALPREPSP